ncbi:hypothetical protein MKW98_004653 [Papaver atlanticum]|uniref:Pre-mRNA-splicing helicase BRR2-like plug domain-containing protein n=1 Tax=Papaver atlanticum TaxID=357466 RepID=A0AAD4SQD4_9MAGN|nr:hypothetical protein MKW98_004653 [Papaver atlanticum]
MEVEMSTGRYDGIPFVPEKGFYQPSSENTREAYQALTSVIECYMNGRVPPHVLVSASDEILSVLKSDFNFGYEKKQQIEKLIGLISLDTFQQLVAIANWITDYTNQRPAYNNNYHNHGDLSGLFYRPSNEANWRSYNLFLDAFKQLIGDQPDMVLRVAADSALLVLKNVDTPTEYRKHVIESELGPASRNWFDHLSSLANLISDYPPLPSPSWETPNWETTAGTNFYPHEFSLEKKEAEQIDIEDYFDNVKFDFEDDIMASDSSSEEEDEKVLRSPYDLTASNDSDDQGTVQGWMKDLTDDDFQEVKVGMQNLRVEREGSSSGDDECERVTVGEGYLTSESCSDEEYQKVKVGVRNLNVGENSDEEWLVV